MSSLAVFLFLHRTHHGLGMYHCGKFLPCFHMFNAFDLLVFLKPVGDEV